MRSPGFKPGDRPLAADWELVELLGRGGFGEVWKARHLTRSNRKPVALKFCLDPVAAHSLRNEASLHDLLDRIREEVTAPGIVPLLETYLNNDPPCLMYEFVEGGNLANFLREQGRLSPEFATRIVQRLASIVGAAHQLTPPLVHRDLSLSNVLLRKPDGELPELFVTDFGIGGLAGGPVLAEQLSRGDLPTARQETALPAARRACTPLYASPQQIAGEDPDPRDDVHAIGVIWYQLVTGDLRLLHVPPDWRELVEEGGLGQELIAILASCIASRVGKRLASGPVLAERLASLLSPVSARGAITEVVEVELSVPGTWFARPSDVPRALWTQIRKTPGKVPLRPGEAYRFVVEASATDGDLWGFTRLNGLAGLESLDLTRCEKVTGAGLAYLQGLVSLRSLVLQECTQLTDAGLAHLADLAGLQVLSLCDCEQLTDAGMVFLRSCKGLKSLSLSGCLLTDAALPHLRGLTALKALDLSACGELTDAGLAWLGPLAELQWLRLAFCTRLTDAGLAYLSGFTALRSLDLRGCKQVTDAGMAALQRVLPRCKIAK